MTDYRVLSTPAEFLAAVDSLAAGTGPSPSAPSGRPASPTRSAPT
ncbi:hypothetical protein [Rathayibacter oskolensis]